jgi:hypothetical protein
MKYKPEILIFSELQFDSMKPGQWFKWNNGARGQWLGKTLAGVDVIRHQNKAFGQPADFYRTRILREYAKRHGSK